MPRAFPSNGNPGTLGIGLNCCCGALRLASKSSSIAMRPARHRRFSDFTSSTRAPTWPSSRGAQHLLEYTAGGGETDQVGLPRLGDLLVEENPHDAHLNLFRAVALQAGIALRVCHSGDQEEVVAGVSFQNAPLAQAVSGRIEYLRTQLQPYATDPVLGGVSLRVSRDQGQGGISGGIAQRRRIDKQQIGEIGVYAIMLSELQQRRGGKAEGQGPPLERMEGRPRSRPARAGRGLRRR